LPDQAFVFDDDTMEKLVNLTDEEIVKGTCQVVLESQVRIRVRLEPLLDYLQSVLESFDIDE